MTRRVLSGGKKLLLTMASAVVVTLPTVVGMLNAPPSELNQPSRPRLQGQGLRWPPSRQTGIAQAQVDRSRSRREGCI